MRGYATPGEPGRRVPFHRPDREPLLERRAAPGGRQGRGRSSAAWRTSFAVRRRGPGTRPSSRQRRTAQSTRSSSTPATAPTTRPSTAPAAEHRSASCPAVARASSPARSASPATRPWPPPRSPPRCRTAAPLDQLGRVNGRRFLFSAGLGFDGEAVRRIDGRGRRADGRRAGNLVFALTIARTLTERHLRMEPQLELDGHGRAAFVFVANGHPYTFAGPLPFTLMREAEFEQGIDFVAPRHIRPHLVPRLLVHVSRGTGASDPTVLAGHDLDELAVRCDRPLPFRPTARISATCSRQRSQPSATHLQFSSRSRCNSRMGPGRALPANGAAAVFDERAVVYHRQGRIGTYAIVWNHEAIQAGATLRSRATTGSSRATASPRSGCCAGCRRRRSSVVARASVGLVEPGGARTSRSICVPIGTHVPHAAGLAWGKQAERRARRARSRSSATARRPRAPSTKARTSQP